MEKADVACVAPEFEGVLELESATEQIKDDGHSCSGEAGELSEHCTCSPVPVDPNFFVNLGWRSTVWNLQKLCAAWLFMWYPHIAESVPVIGDTVTGLAVSFQGLLKVWFVQSVFGYIFLADDTLRLGWKIGLSWLSCFRWMLQTLLLNDHSIKVLRAYAKVQGFEVKDDEDEEDAAKETCTGRDDNDDAAIDGEGQDEQRQQRQCDESDGSTEDGFVLHGDDGDDLDDGMAENSEQDSR